MIAFPAGVRVWLAVGRTDMLQSEPSDGLRPGRHPTEL
jgi:hypothetical protein